MTGIRFGHQIRPAGPIDQLIAEARAAETAGFDVVTIPDHIGTTLHSPMIVATAIAQATETIRIGTFVLNNEMRNPVQLAWEAATLDRISCGRFELGLGAGHTPYEFDATGVELQSAATRKARLFEAVEVIRRLLDGETVTHHGEHYRFNGAAIEPPDQKRLPILVGGNGKALATHAGEHADIVGLTGMGRTLADGHRHAVKWSLDRLTEQLHWVACGAAGRPTNPEINVLVQAVEVTNDRESALAGIAERAEGLTLEDARNTPFIAMGTHGEIADQIRSANERFGIGYFVTRDIEAMAPVIRQIAGS